MNEVLFIETDKGEKSFLFKEGFKDIHLKNIKRSVLRCLWDLELEKIKKIDVKEIPKVVNTILNNEPYFEWKEVV